MPFPADILTHQEIQRLQHCSWTPLFTPTPVASRRSQAGHCPAEGGSGSALAHSKMLSALCQCLVWVPRGGCTFPSPWALPWFVFAVDAQAELPLLGGGGSAPTEHSWESTASPATARHRDVPQEFAGASFRSLSWHMWQLDRKVSMTRR